MARDSWDFAYELLTLDPNNHSAGLLQACVWGRLGFSSRAFESLNRIPVARQDVDYWIVRAHCLQDSKQDESAIEAWRHALPMLSEKPDGVSRKLGAARLAFRNCLLRLGRTIEAGVVNCERLNIPRRDSTTPAHLVDLSLSYSSSLGSPTRFLSKEEMPEDWPTGVRDFGGVSFDVRGVVSGSSPWLGTGKPQPAAVGVKGAFVHFLHSTTYENSGQDGLTIASYVIHFADRTKASVPVVYGQDVRGWSGAMDSLPPSRAPITWTGSNAISRKFNHQFRLFKMSWKNPKPEVVIDRIEFDYGPVGGPLLFTLGISAQNE